MRRPAVSVAPVIAKPPSSSAFREDDKRWPPKSTAGYEKWLLRHAAPGRQRGPVAGVSDGALADAHPDVPEPRRGGVVARVTDLQRLALAAVRHAPDRPLVCSPDGVERGPERGADARVRGVLEHAAQPAV